MIGKNRQPPNTFFPSFRGEWEIKKSKYSSEERLLWADLLHEADWNTGEFSVSYSDVQKECGWTKAKTEWFFKRMIKDGTIEINKKGNSKNQQTTYIFCLFKIEDHKRKYENSMETNRTVNKTVDENHMTVNRTDNNKQYIDFKGFSESLQDSRQDSLCDLQDSKQDDTYILRRKKLKKLTTRPSADATAEPETSPAVADSVPQPEAGSKREDAPPAGRDSGTKECGQPAAIQKEADLKPIGHNKQCGEGNDTAERVLAAREPLKSAWGGKRYTEDSFRAASTFRGECNMHRAWHDFFENTEKAVPKFDETGQMKGQRTPTPKESMCRPCEWECSVHGWVTGQEWRPEHFNFGGTFDSANFLKREDSVVTPCPDCVIERLAAKQEKAGLDAAAAKAREHIAVKINRHTEAADALLKERGMKATARYIGENMIAEMGNRANNGIVKQDFYEIERWLAAAAPRKILGIIINSIDRRNVSGGDPYSTWGYFTKSILNIK